MTEYTTEPREPGDTPDRCGACGAICDDDLGCECGVECARLPRGGIDRPSPPAPAAEDDAEESSG